MDQLCTSYFNSSTEFQSDVKVAIFQDHLPFIIATIAVVVIIFGACFGPSLGRKCHKCCKQ